MASTVNCTDCGVSYVRGRGRPPKVPLCSPCTNARWAKEPGRAAKARPAPDERLSVSKPSRSLPAREDVSEWLLPEDSGPVLHGATSQAVTQPCPKCGYAYADGGYCGDCGWVRDLQRHPYGSITGRRF